MSDRRLNPISDAELDRRWKAARAMMTARGLDALVMQNNNDWLGGYVKWFTDFPAYNGYPRTVIFHAGDPMTVIDMGPAGGRRGFEGREPCREIAALLDLVGNLGLELHEIVAEAVDGFTQQPDLGHGLHHCALFFARFGSVCL